MAATPYFGSLSDFQAELESIKSYIERVTIFFTANNIAADHQVAILLSYIGGKTYDLLRNLLAPKLPLECELATLIETLENHFEPKSNLITERYKFHKKSQLPTESVAEFIAELRPLATHCEFNATLNDSLRDRLVVGLRSESILKRLLSQKTLTFAEACDIARSMEAADCNTKSMQEGGNNVNQVRMKFKTPPSSQCHFGEVPCLTGSPMLTSGKAMLPLW